MLSLRLPSDVSPPGNRSLAVGRCAISGGQQLCTGYAILCAPLRCQRQHLSEAGREALRWVSQSHVDATLTRPFLGSQSRAHSAAWAVVPIFQQLLMGLDRRRLAKQEAASLRRPDLNLRRNAGLESVAGSTACWPKSACRRKGPRAV